jgi:hypothetical protein
MADSEKQELKLIRDLADQDMLHQLIRQLNKDLKLSGLDHEFKTETRPEQLIESLQEFIFSLMTKDFGNYLNFLYRVDVSEAKIKSIPETDALRISERMCILILQREWQKVWFRNKIQ